MSSLRREMTLYLTLHTKRRRTHNRRFRTQNRRFRTQNRRLELTTEDTLIIHRRKKLKKTRPGENFLIYRIQDFEEDRGTQSRKQLTERRKKESSNFILLNFQVSCCYLVISCVLVFHYLYV